MSEALLPSGMVLDIRGWCLADQEALLDQKDDAQALTLRMAELGTIRCLEPGPYGFGANAKPSWSEVSIDDIQAANVLIRAITDDGIFRFDRSCDSCGRKKKLEIAMKDVEIISATEEGKQHLASKQPIVRPVMTAKGPAEVDLRILRGQHLPEIAKRGRKDQKLLLRIQHCLSIQSIRFLDSSKPMTSLREILEFWGLPGQPWALGRTVKETLEQAGGGPDLYADWTCDNVFCSGRDQQTLLPLDHRFYGLEMLLSSSRRSKPSSGADSPAAPA